MKKENLSNNEKNIESINNDSMLELKVKKQNKIIILLLIIIVVICCGVLFYYIFSKNIEKIDDNNNINNNNNIKTNSNNNDNSNNKDEQESSIDQSKYKKIIEEFVLQFNSQIDKVNSMEPYSYFDNLIKKIKIEDVNVINDEDGKITINYNDEKYSYYIDGLYYYDTSSGGNEGELIPIDKMYTYYEEYNYAALYIREELYDFKGYKEYMEKNESCEGTYWNSPYKDGYFYYILFDYDEYGEEFNPNTDKSCTTFKYNVKTKKFEE